MADQGWIPGLAPWQVRGTQTLSTHRIFRVLEDEVTDAAGERAGRFVRLACPDWVNVITLRDDGCVALVEQYRHGTREVTLEIPGGMVDGDELPLEAAIRELREETGLRASHWHAIGTMSANPAFQDNRCTTFVAWWARGACAPAPDAHEELRLHWVPLAQVGAWVVDGTLHHGVVVAALLRYHLWAGGWVVPDLGAGLSWTEAWVEDPG
jgi:8-oxo-dGTP pyrophosphatase MutT (NUDIX family)